MADVRPLSGLRYAATDDLAALVTPPYDVISPEAQAAFYARHAHNFIRLELGREDPADTDLDNRYTRAAATFAEWRLTGLLRQDSPAFYLYEQRFASGDGTRTRVSLLARARLEPWDAGVILPHERTLSKPKDDRLKLLRATAANLSPILSMYDDPDHELRSLLTTARASAPATAFADDLGDEHRLWMIADALHTSRIVAFFASRQLYIADGHHRYETALTYRDEVHHLRRELPEHDAVRFVLMSLVAIEEPGLVVLPTHRLLRDIDPDRLSGLDDTLAPWFTSEPLDSPEPDAWLARLTEAGATTSGASAGTVAFVLVRPAGATLLRLRPEGQEAVRAGAPSGDVDDEIGRSDAWRALDVAILHELVLGRGLGIASAAIRAGKHVTYTRDAAEGAAAVRAHRADLAALINPTPPAGVRDVARAGDRMPQKSTYFYPKLISGLVINPLW